MIAIAVFFVFFITSCQHNSEDASLYLSIAATYYDDGVGPEKGMSTLIYQYNLNKDTGKTVDKVKYKSQYPLAIYSEEENVIYYTSYDKINRGDQIWSYNIGNKTTVKIVKNKVAPPFKTAVVEIMYGEGVSRVSEIIDLGVEAGIIDKSGAWYAYKGEKIGQGKENVKMYLKANPKLKDELEKQVRDFYSKKEVIDETTEVVEE